MMTQFVLLLVVVALALGGSVAVAEPAPDAGAIEPLAAELASRAEAGDVAYVAGLLGNGGGPEAAADMIARIKRADVRKTFRKHLEGRGPDAAGLNYHEPSHFQVELRKGAGGKWEVGRLWVCR